MMPCFGHCNVFKKGSGMVDEALGFVDITCSELERLKEEVKSATENEKWLDSAIVQMQTSLRELADDETNAQYAYVTHEDVRNIPAFEPLSRSPA